MVLTTAEVRWFYDGRVPGEFRAWFVGLSDHVRSEPVRVDHYLPVDDTDTLGIKFREGRIEVKQRLAPPRRIALGCGVGTLELWRKWGFSLAQIDGVQEMPELCNTWTPVEKQRLLCDYRIGPAGEIEPLEAPDLTIPTCSVELTDVRARTKTAWTLAFEADGPMEALTPTLAHVARKVLSTAGGAEMEREHSYGYPRWLQLIQP
jgi:hypothetical protein